MQGETFTIIEIFISGRNLRDLDFFSKSDPYVQVSYKRDFNCKNYSMVGRTETVKDNLNPTFSRSFKIDYIFESKQDIMFEVFDDDGGNDDVVGSVITTVGALMGSKNQTMILDIKDKGKSQGKLVVRCEPISESGGNFGVIQNFMNSSSKQPN